MSRLALLATLLLLLAPTADRLLASSSGPHGVWSQMCAMAGLKAVRTMHDDAGADTQPVLPDDGTPMDCDYCPLLASLTELTLWVVPVLHGPTAALATGTRSPRLSRGHPCGLGCRGPPIAA